MGSFVVGEEGMWISNGLHHLWCEAEQCYVVSEECLCRFCGCAGVEKYHLLRCEWANCEQLHVNRDNIWLIVKCCILVIGLHRWLSYIINVLIMSLHSMI